MGPGLGPAQPELGPTGDDLALVLDVVADHVPQAERPRHAFDQRDHVHAERGLELGLLEQVVEHDVRHRAALQLDHDPHAGAVGLVAQVGDPFELLVPDQGGDLDDEAGVTALLDRERQFGHDQRVLAALERLRVHPAAHPHAAAAGSVGLADVARVHDAATREVRSLDVFHQAVEADLRVVDEGGHRAGDFTQVVRWDVGRHADRDSGGAVDQEVREARRQDQRLTLRLVVVGAELDRVRVDVAQHLRGQAGEPGLGVTHRGSRVVVDRTEVALAVGQRVAQGEVLRHADQRVVDRSVAMGVVLAHDFADDRGALAVRAVRLQAEVVHRVEHPAMHRLEPVAHVGQRPADDHAHRVIDVGRAHLQFEFALLDVSGQGFERHQADVPVRAAAR